MNRALTRETATEPFISFLIASLSAGLISAETASWKPATTSLPRYDWIGRHNGFVARARDGGVNVLFIGDSIADAWRNLGNAIWMERYAPMHAANFVIGDGRTEHVLWPLQNSELNGITPRVAVLTIGKKNTHRDTTPQIVKGAIAIVKEIRERTPRRKFCSSRSSRAPKKPTIHFVKRSITSMLSSPNSTKGNTSSF